MATPRLSICIPTYNRGAILRDTLEHLAGLDLPGLEVVVTDNCSDDDTQDVLAEFGARFERFATFRQSHNRGPQENCASSLNMATGDYVYTLSDDDRVIAAGLAAAMAVLDRAPDVAAVYGGYQEWDPATNTILATQLHVAEPTRFEPADKVQLLNTFNQLWCPVARREILQRHCYYDNRTWGLMRIVGQLMNHGAIVILPDLFYQHAHTAQRLENQLVEPWYHDQHRSDYELFLADAVDQPDAAQVGHFIGLRSAPAYVTAATIARKQGQYLTARHYLLRAKAYGTFTGDALAKWEADNLYHVLADRIRALLLDAPQVTTLVFEACDIAAQCIAALPDDLPGAVTVTQQELTTRPGGAHEYFLALDYETLAGRDDFAPQRMRALSDLIETCRVTKAR